MVKVESILKWKLEGPVLKKIKLMRSQILSKNEDAVALPDSDLHVTLASGPGWKEIRRQAKSDDFDEPEFKIDIEPTFKVMEQGGKKSWYVRMKDQRSWKEYVMDLLQGTHDARRIYHVSIANLTGKVGDSIAMVEERDYKDEYKKFQSSKKMKKYRAELNRYNRRKGTYGNGDGKDASHKNGKIVGHEDESVNRGRAEKSRLKGSIREDFYYLDEEITPEQLAGVKKSLNKQFAPLGIKVDLQTKEFLKRKDDKRNIKPISSAELIGVFKRAAKKWKSNKFTDTIMKTVDPETKEKDQQAVIYDPKTDINIAAVLNTTRSKSPEFVIKTIMRKKDFKTRSPRLVT